MELLGNIAILSVAALSDQARKVSRMLTRFNRWYDQLKEPWRFLGMCLMVWPPILAISLWEHMPFWFVLLFGGVLLSLLAMRMWWCRYGKIA